MRCDELKRWLYAEMDGEVGVVERGAVQRHLGGCAACRHAREAVETLEAHLLEAAGAARVDVARDEAVLAALREQGYLRPSSALPITSLGRWRARPLLVPRWAGIALASGAAAALLWLGVRMGTQHPAPRPPLLVKAGPHGRLSGAPPLPPPVLHQPDGTQPRVPRRETVMPERSMQRTRLSARPLRRPAAPSPRRPEPLPAPRVRRPVPDEQYLDGRDPQLLAYWSGAAAWRKARLVPPTVPTGDDFVFVPFPQLASAAPGGGTAMSEAVHQYEAEKRVVDPRLFQQVTLREKAAALGEICQAMESQTGVKLQANRVVADEKATVLVAGKPAREVMREIARLFGYQWLRSGEPGAYKYELTQDLRSQLDEEQLRNQDIQKALLDLDAQMSVYRPYLEQSVDALLDRWKRAEGGEKKRLSDLVKNGGWGPARLYFRLSPAERGTLQSGSLLNYSMEDPNPDRRLPADWRLPLLKSSGQVMLPNGTTVILDVAQDRPSTPIEQVPNAEPQVFLKLDRSEAGEFTLVASTHIQVKIGGKMTKVGGYILRMATGRSPSTTKPDNAAANQALRTAPPFQHAIDLQPQPSCPRLAAEPARKREFGLLYQNAEEPELREPHVNTADVWEEIHRRTGLPIVADSYMHLYPVSSLTLKQTSTFDALCQVGDRIGVRWRKDGDFLLGRSTSYFWDKLKEVPNRLLGRWQQDSRANDGLPLADFLEMASLSDQQLGSKTAGEQICHCWELDEWGIIGGGPFVAGIVPEVLRKGARTLSLLTPAQLAQALKPEGLSLAELTAAQQQGMEELLYDLPSGTPPHFHVDYVPSGRYLWQPFVTQAEYKAGANRWPVVAAKTAAEALADARRFDPAADAGDIHRTRGRLDFTFLLPGGERHSTGGPLVRAPLD